MGHVCMCGAKMCVRKHSAVICWWGARWVDIPWWFVGTCCHCDSGLSSWHVMSAAWGELGMTVDVTLPSIHVWYTFNKHVPGWYLLWKQSLRCWILVFILLLVLQLHLSAVSLQFHHGLATVQHKKTRVVTVVVLICLSHSWSSTYKAENQLSQKTENG